MKKRGADNAVSNETQNDSRAPKPGGAGEWITQARTFTDEAVRRPEIDALYARIDAHEIKPHEYKELPELTDEMLARAVVHKGWRPRSESPGQLISLRLPPRRHREVASHRSGLANAGPSAWRVGWGTRRCGCSR